MPNANQIRSQIEGLTNNLISFSLCDHQNYPSIKKYPDGYQEVRAGNIEGMPEVLRNKPYDQIYKDIEAAGAYNLKMLDGALIQMQYRFRGNSIVAHRLAFFPSPEQESFQHLPEIYLEKEIFTESIASRNAPFPIRFDFEKISGDAAAISHPQSHLTLGHYNDCRIPVRSPLTPSQFISFLLHNFYDTKKYNFSSKLHPFKAQFDETVTKEERKLTFLHTP